MIAMSNDLFQLKRKQSTCCVPHCPAFSDSDTSYHSFPRDVELRKKWQEGLRIDVVDDSMKVCGAHFSSDNFFPTFGEFKTHKLKVKRLKRNAAPTRFLPVVSPSSPSAGCSKGNNEDCTTRIGFSLDRPEQMKSDPYSMETYCCTTCGHISSTEALFYEHLNSHVKIESVENDEADTVDPLGSCQPTDPLVPSALVKQEEEECPYSPEDDERGYDETLPDEGCHPDDADGGTIDDDEEEEDEEEMNEPYSEADPVDPKASWTRCNFCYHKYKNISLHLAAVHLAGPLIDEMSNQTEPPLESNNTELLKECLSGGPADKLVITDSLILWGNEFAYKMRGALARKKTTRTRRRYIRYPPFTKRMLEEGDQHSLTLYKTDRKYRCSYCDFNSNDSRLAKAHFQLHCDGKPFGCHGCQKYYDTEEELMEKHTTGTNHSVCRSIVPLDFRLRCDECWMFFGTQQELLFHLIHEDCPRKIKVPCSVCCQKVIKCTMDVHLLTHRKNT